jgi:hypothetical protein
MCVSGGNHSLFCVCSLLSHSVFGASLAPQPRPARQRLRRASPVKDASCLPSVRCAQPLKNE